MIAGIIGTIALARPVAGLLYTEMMVKDMSGWMPLHIGYDVYIKMFIIGICSYAAVALFELLKIRKVPMNMILKEAT